jgi:hypothetical protein
MFEFGENKKSTRYQIYKKKNYKGVMQFEKASTIDVQSVLETGLFTAEQGAKEAIDYYNSSEYHEDGYVANAKPFKLKDIKISYILNEKYKHDLFASKGSYNYKSYYRYGYVIKNTNNEYVPIESQTNYNRYGSSRTTEIGLLRTNLTTTFNGEKVFYNSSNGRESIYTVVQNSPSLNVYQVRFHL